MLVYRVENQDGIGPYRCRYVENIDEKTLQWIYKYDEILADKHTPWRSTYHQTISSVMGFECGMVCGFDSKEKLKKWFHGFRYGLRKNGFVCNVYEVAKAPTDGRQVCFDKKKARLVRTIKIP